MKRFAAGLFLLAVVVSLSASASAHGERESTDPKAGETLKRPPKHVYINLTEAPSKGGVVNVRDGCGNEVPLDLVAVERTLHATLSSKGEPGKWRVGYRAISKVDGHATKDAFIFTVRGQKDCSSEGNVSDPVSSEGSGPAASGDQDSGARTEEGIGSGAFVAVLAGVGGLMLLGILWTVRSILQKREG